MFSLFKKKTSTSADQNITPSQPIDGCAYVIGDIHGCFDELLELLGLIEEDAIIQPDDPKYIVFLGDLMDRGPKSKGVVDFLINYKPNFATPVFLMGNHEEFFLDVLSGKTRGLVSWFDFGGRECSRSYGVENLGEIYTNPKAILNRLQEKVPQSHIDFISGFRDSFQFGHYLCVHAGIRPQVPIEEQTSRDMRWIRREFLEYTKSHPFVIVHGHTIVERAEILPNRIAVDTGVYNSGLLTAIRLSDTGTKIIETRGKS